MEEYPISQVNGQRKYGPPNGWTEDPPGRGTEVFVSRIPRDCKEDEIAPLFSRIGKIYTIRLMMDFSGTNRGFCFVQYTNTGDADLAILKLDGAEIRPGNSIKVVRSVDNRRLFVGHIPKNKTREEIFTALSEVVSGLVDIILYLSPTDKNLNRGFCFAEFNSHRSAAMARRVLVSQEHKFWSQDIRVDWAVPEAQVDESIMSKVTVLYLRNLLLKSSEQTIRSAVLNFVCDSELTRLRKVRDFAFIHFSSRDAAERAMQGLRGYYIDDVEVFVTWARPTRNVKNTDNTCSVETNQMTNTGKQQNFAITNRMSTDNSWVDQQNALVPAGVYTPNFNCRKDYIPRFSSVPQLNNSFHMYSENILSPDAVQLSLLNTVMPYLLNSRPSAALQEIASLFGWGIVSYEVSAKVTESFGYAAPLQFIAVVLITKDNKTVAYPHVHHNPAFTTEQAKDLVAESFFYTYIVHL